MHEFHGDLLVGGLAIHDVHGTLHEETKEAGSGEWSGQLEIEPTQEKVLEVGRQYLLMLADGRNAEVMITEMHTEPQQKCLVCDFTPWHRNQLPPK